MIDLGLVVNGVAIGLAVAAPIGPVNLIVIRRTLRYGPVNGFLSGGGAAAGDALFAVIAAFGITQAIDFVIRIETLLQIVGGCFLLGLGLRMRRRRTATATRMFRPPWPRPWPGSSSRHSC